MKIAIMGSGAVGSMFGAKFFKTGQDVCLIDGWGEHVRKIQVDGLDYERNEEKYNVKINAVSSAEEAKKILGGYADLVMIFCKGMDTEESIKKSMCLVGDETSVLTLQNGIGNAETIGKYVPHNQVFFGAAYVASALLGPGSVKDTTSNRSNLIHIMPLDGEMNNKCIEVADVITKAGMDTKATLEAECFVWQKLALNCCVNATSVLTHMCMKDMTNDVDGFVLFNRIVNEIAEVAKVKNVEVDFDLLRAFVHLSGHKSTHYPSMLQDAKKKRPLELETITGAIVREGKKYGVLTPVNETIMLLTSMVSSNYDNLWD